MSDVPVPSYRLRPAEAGLPWRLFGIAAALAGAVALAAGAWWAVARLSNRSVPVIEADSRPIRVRPTDPGGLTVPNQDNSIFTVRPGQRLAPPPAARLAPEPEAPNLGQLRAASSPPPAAQPAPRPAAPPAPPAPATPQAAVVPPVAATPPPPARPAAAPTASAARGSVQVQLGALATEEAARAEWERLARRMPELLADRRPQIARFDRDGATPVWRLRTGGFPDAATARGFCESVRSRGGGCATIGG